MFKPRKVRAVAERHSVGNEIVLQSRHAADERVRADAGELDHGRAAADDREIADIAVPGQHDVVGEDDAVAHAAVVPHVAVGEERATVAHHRRRSAAGSAGIHRHAFANDAIGADGERARLALVFQVLRLVPDGGERKDARARADFRRPGDRDMADEFDAFAKRCLAPDHAERADLHACRELCALLDNGGSVNIGLSHACSQTPLRRRYRRASR